MFSFFGLTGPDHSRFRPRGEGELEATFINKDEEEEEYELEYITFDRHVLVWVVGE